MVGNRPVIMRWRASVVGRRRSRSSHGTGARGSLALVTPQGGTGLILSMAHAEVTQATRDNLYGEWSELIVGARPDGLVSCYLVEDADSVRVMAVWSDLGSHDRALADEGTHPAFAVFEAAGVDPQHTVLTVLGSLT